MDNNNMDGIEWERVTVDKSLLERYDKLKSQADELARALEAIRDKQPGEGGMPAVWCRKLADKALSNYRKGE